MHLIISLFLISYSIIFPLQNSREINDKVICLSSLGTTGAFFLEVGTCTKDIVIKRVVRIMNDTDDTVEILYPLVSCSCLDVIIYKKTIKSGEFTDMAIGFHCDNGKAKLPQSVRVFLSRPRSRFRIELVESIHV